MEPEEEVGRLRLDLVVDGGDISLKVDNGGLWVSYSLSYQMEISMHDIEGWV